jgi:hypothetical protein
MHATVHRTTDFDLDGTGSAPAWAAAEPITIPPVDGQPGHATTAALLYSPTGLYARFQCNDHRLACSGRLADGGDLWHEDVVEAFFWPEELQRLYFEYELSPLNRELPLLVANHAGTFMGWSPWHYEGDRRLRNATSVRGGRAEPGAAIAGWSAEFFLPFTLLQGLGNVPPTPGTRWRANLCRIDHDTGTPRLHSWSAGITNTFHAIERFGTLTFE